jgi:hypothetical protein
MKSNEILRWCEYVRGTLPEEERRRCDELLRSADAETTAWVGSLRQLVELGEEERQRPVPEATVRVVKAFAATSSKRGSEADGWLRLAAKTLFDSWLDAAPAGARDLTPSQRIDRQMSIQAGPFVLDLRLEQEPAERRMIVVGQLVREVGTVEHSDVEHSDVGHSDIEHNDTEHNDIEPVAQVAILLTAGGQVVDSSVTSELGEFEVQGRLGSLLVLSLVVDEATCIELPLGEA